MKRLGLFQQGTFAAGLASAALLFVHSAGAQQPGQDADVEIPSAPKAAPPAQPPPAPPPSAPPAAKPAAPPAPPPNAEIEALRREMRASQEKTDAKIAALEAELAAAKKTADPPAPPAAAQLPLGAGATPWVSTLGPGIWGIAAYLQAQYENHQDSEDQIQQGGTLLNQDRFLVRRGRVRLDAAWRYAELAIELEANTVRGVNALVRRAEGTIVWRGKQPWTPSIVRRWQHGNEVPLVALTVGLTDIPFGYELLESPRERVFMERSLASQSLFPGERDVGAVLSGGVGFFRYALAMTNGDPPDDRNPRGIGDPTKAKDFVVRVGVDTRPTESINVAGGVSALYGRGFHPGTDATKDTIQWSDLNQNGSVEFNELTPLPGSAATPSVTFPRWAIGADLSFRIRSKIGWTAIQGEAVMASNLDRALMIADPITTGIDVRHFGAAASVVQQITPYGIVGFRFDYYDPNADFFDKRGGKLLPSSQAIKTFSPIVGVQLPDRAKLLFQYDVVRDLFAKDAVGVPTDLKNDRFTIRLQVQL